MIEKFELYMPSLEENRRIHVYLPDDYHTSNLRYPVLYLFDGHNMFLDEDATYGHSWNFPKYLDAYPEKCIVVGQECSHTGHNRLSEYAPFTFQDPRFGVFPGKGDKTMDFFVNTLKPYIDTHYRTKKTRKDTWIGGSSCGGLMAFYAQAAFSDVYSKAACVSPYFFPSIQKMKDLVRKTEVHKNSQFYISWGALEGGAHAFVSETVCCTDLSNLLQEKGNKVYFNVKENGQHTEQDWEEEVPIILDFLFENGPFRKD